jgi:hypothetical protein
VQLSFIRCSFRYANCKPDASEPADQPCQQQEFQLFGQIDNYHPVIAMYRTSQIQDIDYDAGINEDFFISLGRRFRPRKVMHMSDAAPVRNMI